jgi:spore coat protein CotH
MRRLIVFLILLLVAAAGWWLSAVLNPGPVTAPPLPRPPPRALPGDAIFKQPTLLRFKIELSPKALDGLRREPRNSVAATVTIDGEAFTNVAIHLKGAAGSFRHVDDRPALTLSFSKFEEGRRWVGLRKIHLNNSVQDSSFMNEYLASELYRAANVPTPRVAFATVQLNERKLGLYVLKEGFTDDFLSCFFRRAQGNLYDGGFLTDVDRELELDSGKGEKDHADLKALTEAAREGNPARRWERLSQKLEVERFITFAALSVMTSDWDGYPLNRNNYRVYFNPSNGRAVFLPHGMDQLFGNSGMDIFPGFNALVSRGLLETPPGRQRYEERFPEVFTEVFRLEPMTNTIARLADLLRPVQPDIDHRARELRERIAARVAYLERQPLIKSWRERQRAAQLAAQTPPPTVKDMNTPGPPAKTANPPAGPARSAAPAAIALRDWKPAPSGNGKLEALDADGRRVLQIVAQDWCTASWRTTLRLKPGRYRFEGQARGSGIQAIRDDKGEGAGLRISGSAGPRANKLSGDTGWSNLVYEFAVADSERDVVFVCELRARKGQAQFDERSLRVQPLP